MNELEGKTEKAEESFMIKELYMGCLGHSQNGQLERIQITWTSWLYYNEKWVGGLFTIRWMDLDFMHNTLIKTTCTRWL